MAKAGPNWRQIMLGTSVGGECEIAKLPFYVRKNCMSSQLDISVTFSTVVRSQSTHKGIETFIRIYNKVYMKKNFIFYRAV